MMKKTQLKNLIKSIQKSGVSFFAVAFIAATSIAIYCGLMFSADAELQSANRYFDKQRLANFEITGANGITQADVDALVSSGTVSEAEGGYTAMAVMEQELENIVVQVRSRSERINQPVLVSGELPQGKNEIAVEEMMADKKGIAVGDTIRLSHDGMLYETEFKVTGIVNEPGFNCTKVKDARGRTDQGLGAASFFVETSAEAFDPSYYHGSFPVAYLRDDNLDGIYYFSDEYTSASDARKKVLKDFGAERAQIRYQELKDEADGKLADARSELDDAKKELADGKDELAANETKLADGRKELEEQEGLLADAKAELLSILDGHMAKDFQAAYDEVKGTDHPMEASLAEYLDGEKAAAEARKNLEDGEKELVAARTEIAGAEKELAEAEQKLADGKNELAAQEAKLAGGLTELEKQEAVLAETKKQLLAALSAQNMGEDLQAAYAAVKGSGHPLEASLLEYLTGEKKAAETRTTLENGEKELAATRTEIANKEAELASGQKDLKAGRDELAANEAKLAEGRKELADQETLLADAKKELLSTLDGHLGQDIQAAYDQVKGTDHPLEASLLKYLDGEKEAAEARTKLEDGEKELADARSEIANAETELADAEQKLADAQADADEIRKKDWVVLSRDEMGDVRSIESVVEGMRGLSYSMAIIFLIVAVVICYASVARLISEQRVLIGAQKALGFSSGEILRHYMYYNVLCAMLGILIGLVAAVVIVELLVLFVAYAGAFLFKDIQITFVWKDALISIVLCFAVFMTATYGACAKLVKTPATQLLRGEMPVKGKGHFFEKWSCYQKLSLYNKAMIKNVLQDKGRAAVTIMGVVGSIALLVICFSMKFAIEDAPVRQYNDYYFYNQRLVVDSVRGDVEEFRALLERENVPYAKIQEKVKAFRVNGGSYSTVHVVATTNEEALADWVRIEDISTKDAISIPQEGVLISRRCAEENNLKQGDVIEIADAEGNPVAFDVAGVIEHYLPTHLFYMSPEYYESRMGEPIDECVFLIKDVPEKVADEARGMQGFLSLNDNSDEFNAASNLTLVIVICLVLSAVMALLVLLNQGIMYINRKSRELAVMRVNGFTLSQTRAYVYKDNIVLTLIGLLLGSGAGVGLSYIIVRFLEVDATRYVRDANGMACLLACLVGSVFAIIVNLMALRRINHLNLTNVSSN